MSRLIQFIFQGSSFFTFVILEMFCFYLIVNFNSQQRSIYLETFSVYTGSMTEQVDELNSYLGLRQQVDELQTQMAALRAQLPSSYYAIDTQTDSVRDDSLRQRFVYVPAQIVNRSPYGLNNTFIINKGAIDSVYRGQGVISEKGILGIVTNVSQYHARAMSVLHRDLRISAGLRSGFFGTLSWDGNDPRYMILDDMKDYAKVEPKDTVFTTSFSSVFPTDLSIGIVVEKNRAIAEGNWRLSIQLLNEPLRERYVYLVQDLYKEDLARLYDQSQ